MDTELRELLERLHDKYNRPEFIECDPISVPHRYAGRTDREIAGFFAATIAWGNRKAIVANGHRMMRCMDDAPADFVRNASDRELATLETYVHRTFNGRDLRDFLRTGFHAEPVEAASFGNIPVLAESATGIAASRAETQHTGTGVEVVERLLFHWVHGEAGAAAVGVGDDESVVV